MLILQYGNIKDNTEDNLIIDISKDGNPGYIDNGWNVFQNAYINSLKIYNEIEQNNKKIDIIDVNNAIMNLNEATFNLQIDYEPLQDKIDDYKEAYDNKDKLYIEDQNWEIFKEKYDTAQKIDNTNPTKSLSEIENIKSTIEDLKEAYKSLRYVANKNVLNKILEDYKEIYESNGNGYSNTNNAWSDFKEAYELGEEIKKDSNVADLEVSLIVNKIMKAQNALKIDYDSLQKLVDSYENLTQDKYTTDTWNSFKVKYGEAIDILSNKDDKINTAERATTVYMLTISLQKAGNELQLKPDKTATSQPTLVNYRSKLKDLIKDAEELEKEDYTKSSWREFERTLERAKEIKDDRTIPISTIKEMISELRKAMKNLEKLEKNENSSSNIDSNEENNSNNQDNNSENESNSNNQQDITSPESTISFIDIKNHWAEETIKNMTNKKLFNGTSETTFSPDDYTTRGMIITVLYRFENKPTITNTKQYDDVSESAYYSEPIKWARENNIVNGIGNNLFAPDRNVTREEFVTIIYNYMLFKQKEIKEINVLSGYEDIADVSDYAKESIQWAITNGIIKGRTKTHIVPKGNATRAELATILERIILKYNFNI